MTYPNRAAIATTLALLLVSCGGGGGGDPVPVLDGPSAGVPDAESSDTRTYHFYVGSIGAVDPNNPAAPLTVESDLPDWAYVFPAGKHDATALQLKDERPYKLVYAKSGQFWKVSADLGGALNPGRLSTESEAFKICDISADVDPTNPEETLMVYEVPGQDVDCATSGDNIWRMVSLGMDEFDVPLAAKPVLYSTNDPNTGKLTNWLVKENNQLLLYDANFSQGEPLIAYTSIAGFLGSWRGKIVLGVDNGIYVFDSATKTLSARKMTITSAIRAVVFDGTVWIYSRSSISAFSLENNNTATSFVSVAAPRVISAVALSDDKLVFVSTDETTGLNNLTAVPRAGGLAETILTDFQYVLPLYATGNMIYFNSLDASGIPVARAIADDGTNAQEHPNAAWVGGQVPVNQPEASLDKIVLLDGFKNVDAGYGGGTLTVYSAKTHTPNVILGTLPADIRAATIPRVSYARDGLMWGLARSTVDNNYDVLYFDIERANSLVRVTNTPEKSEAIL